MPHLDFLADMNLSPLTVRQLRERGWKIKRVSEVLEDELKLGIVASVDDISARFRSLPITRE